MAVYTAENSAAAARNRAETRSPKISGIGGDNKKLAGALGERHPWWEQQEKFWQKALDLKEGTNLGAYIDKHARESKASHDARKARVGYRNYLSAVITLYRHYIFSKPVTRRALPENLQAEKQKAEGKKNVSVLSPPAEQEWEEMFLPDVDRQGTHIDRFIGDQVELAADMGKTYILVDLPELVKGLRSEEQRIEMGVRPYFTPYTPLEAVNWHLDRDGQLEWIRFAEIPSDDLGEFESRSDRVKATMARMDTGSGVDTTGAGRKRKPTDRGPIQYRTWTRKNWTLHRVEGDKVEEVAGGTHSLGLVPVVSLYYRRSPRYPFGGLSLVQDISTLQQRILNLDSLIDTSCAEQTLSILVLGHQSVQGEEVVIGENNALEVGPNSIAPYFITPSQGPLQFMEQRIQLLAQEIYRLSKFGGGFGLEPKAVAPTTAAYEFNLTNRALADFADNIQSAENQLHAIWFRWMQQEFRGTIDYPDDFSIQSFLEDLQTITQAGDAIRSPTFRRELERKIARKILGTADAELLQQVDQETSVIPDVIKTFTGPIWYDAVTQRVSTGGGWPIGQVALALQQQEAQAGGMPAGPLPPPGMPPPEEGGDPDGEGGGPAASGGAGGSSKSAGKQPAKKPTENDMKGGVKTGGGKSGGKKNKRRGR
jgi:hypothetical protein